MVHCRKEKIDIMAKITTCDELRKLYPSAAGRAMTKVIDHLDAHCRLLIAHSPYLLMSSQNTAGAADITPKGDAPGFVQVLDDSHISIPDRPGNNRLDTMENILENPNVGLIFLIPGWQETLRINGRAEIRDDGELKKAASINGREPASCFVIEVKEAFIHCAKSIMRAKLWEPESQIAKGTLPSTGQMLRDHAGGSGPIETEEEKTARYTKQLY
jgi:PPOX class probable FMN-dependent enzyme